MAVDLEPLDTAEWFETVQPGVLSLELPPPDTDYCFAATRLLSWFPVVNENGATFFNEDVTNEMLDNAVGTLANLRHDKADVIGTIHKVARTDQGLEIIVRIDREAASLQGMDAEDMRAGNYFSHVSVELTRDTPKSKYYLVDDEYNVKYEIPTLAARKQGLRRTTDADPYRFQGCRVVERVAPKRFTGVGFVPNPADPNAELYALHANKGAQEKPKLADYDKAKHPYGPPSEVHYADPGDRDGKSRYPVDTPEHTASAARFFGNPSNRERYSPEQRAHIDNEIRQAKKKFGIGHETAADHADPGYDGGPMRHPLHTEDDVKRAKNHFNNLPNRSDYTKDQLRDIDGRIDDAMKHLNISDDDVKASYPDYYAEVSSTANDQKEHSMTETEAKALQDRVAVLESEAATLKSEKEKASTEASAANDKIVALEKELADVKAERDTLVAEHEKASREARAEAILKEFEAIKPAKDEAEKASLRELAFKACDDEGIIREVKLTRENEALKEEVAALKTPPVNETEAEKAAREEKEKASRGAVTPATPQYTPANVSVTRALASL